MAKVITENGYLSSLISLCGVQNVKACIEDNNRRIAEMQESMQLMIAMNLVKGDKELEEELRKKLMKKLGMEV